MEETSSLCNHTFWPSDGGFHYNNIAHRSQKLITYLNPTIPTQPMPLTVVLHGPAGVGKTTVAKKLMLDWTQDAWPRPSTPPSISAARTSATGGRARLQS